MLRPATANLEALLRALLDAEISFIVVGGAAAVIHGAPINTRDLDIVPRLTGDDATRLVAVLTALDARFRPILPEIKRSTGRVRDHLAVSILESLRQRLENDDAPAT